MVVRKLNSITVVALCLLGFWQSASAQQPFDHSVWQQLLDRHVRLIDQGRVSQVDYAGLDRDRELLGSYLQSLASVGYADFLTWPTPQQLAFLINTYNAWTVELILTKFPDLNSIRDLGSFFRSPWSRSFIPLFGEEVSLNYIEHDLIRGPDGFSEPRIHFAVNCASIGCPALRKEAYTAENLEQQLDEATRLFLSDRIRNRLDGNTLRVSEIFDWYEEDFEKGWRETDTVGQFLARYSDALELPESVVTALEQGDFRIRYLDYDWDLNSIKE